MPEPARLRQALARSESAPCLNRSCENAYGRVPPGPTRSGEIVCGPAPCWIVVSLRGETAQHRAKPCPLISAKPCPLTSALFLGENLSASAGWHALVRGEDDTGGRRERHTKMGKQARHALAGHGREIPLERKRDCVHNIIDYCSKNRSHGAGWQPLGGSARPAQAE